MADPEDILADNLKEAIKDAHRHIVFGIGTSLFLLLLVIQDRWGSADKTIKVPFVDVNAERAIVQAIAGAAYFISGYLAYLGVLRARRIMGRLQTSPQLREAALMYPAIPTIIISGTRIAAIVLPAVLFLASTAPFLFTLKDDRWQALLFVMILASAPWILLVQQLRYPLSEITYKLTTQSLARLEKAGVEESVVKRLKPLVDQEYPNREQFLDALQKIVAQKLSPRVTRLIRIVACDEEGLEN
jgi:hypothetical protein